MERLVFDIGLNNGDDSAYYLHLGYRVVGIEANPLLAAMSMQRFDREIRAGQMKVVNAGILRESGEFIFNRSLQDDGWSTFESDLIRKPEEWEQIRVRCMTTQQLIQEYGQPYFIKVDIEAADFQVLETLSLAIAPGYISLELNLTDPFLDRLVSLGYSGFKFVDGETYRSTPPIFEHQIAWRMLRKAGRRFPILHNAICKLPKSLHPKQEWNPPGKYS